MTTRAVAVCLLKPRFGQFGRISQERGPKTASRIGTTELVSTLFNTNLEVNMKINNFMVAAVALTSMVSTGCSAAQVKGDRSMTSANNSHGQIYSFESDGNGFNTKTYFYDNGEEVVVFDTQFTPDTAKKSIEFLRTKTPNPITYIVITHPNPDKFNGMRVFQEQGAKVISSRATSDSMKGVHEYKKYYFVNMAKMFTEDTYPKLSQVDVVFDQSYDLRLKNGEVIALLELSNPGVSSNQTVASISSENALVVGDLVHHHAHAWLEGGIVNGKPIPTLKGWIADLNEMQTYFKTTNPIVYGGRGEVVKLDQAVTTQISYLKKADLIVEQYISNLAEKKSELQGDKADQHYAALQAQFEKEFSTYSLGYMIQYGVYGLLNSKL
jgi:glyoxylase-like metal-dependent hydrolase (beta-lactamase superfamily II)